MATAAPIEGEWGDSPYGTEPYGGSQHGGGLLWVLSDLFPAVGSDDPEEDYHWVVGETAHRRDGLIIGARKFGEARHWTFHFDHIRESGFSTDNFAYFFKARFFDMYPDIISDPGTIIPVHWVDKEMRLLEHRGHYLSLTFTLEETGVLTV